MRTSILVSLLSATLVAAQSPPGQAHGKGWHGHWTLPRLGVPVPPSSGNATFTQLLDHSNPSLGTFEQTYWWSTQYWAGPGSPVVIFTPGEVNASEYTGYLGNRTLNGQIAREIGAATIVIEHRYWGFSSPFPELTTANLQYLTLENSIKDLTYFANEVNLPFVGSAVSSNAYAVPWVLIGGSYSGALAAWVESVSPGTFWAYLASSAVVQSISDFWQYFDPVQQGMPQNCSSDVSKVIDYMDGVMINGTAAEQQELKAMFGLESVEHNDDFMAALENGPWLWQGNSFTGTAGFFTWCDYIEDSVGQTDTASLPGAGGVGLEKALQGYATWFQEVQLPGYCESYGYFEGTNNTDCFNTYNASSPLFIDTSLSNTIDRQWNWFLCNQPFGFWQDGAPAGRPSLVSRLVDVDYFTRQCALFFPPGPQGQTYGLAEGKTEAQVNAYTGGWDHVNTTRLVFTNGQYDPWRDSTVSSDFRPGGPLQSTDAVPVNVVPGGFHCTDLITSNGEANAGCAAVQQAEIKQISEFVSQWPRKWAA